MARIHCGDLARPHVEADCLYAVPAEWPNFSSSPLNHRHSAGFPSRRKSKPSKGAWPPDLASFFVAAMYPSSSAGAGQHAFVMFIAPILSSFVAHHFHVRAGHPLPRKTGGGAATRGV